MGYRKDSYRMFVRKMSCDLFLLIVSIHQIVNNINIIYCYKNMYKNIVLKCVKLNI